MLRRAGIAAPGPPTQGAQGLRQGLARAGRDDGGGARARRPCLRLLGPGPGRLEGRPGASCPRCSTSCPHRCRAGSGGGRSTPVLTKFLIGRSSEDIADQLHRSGTRRRELEIGSNHVAQHPIREGKSREGASRGALPKRRGHGHPNINLGRSSGLRHSAGVDAGRRSRGGRGGEPGRSGRHGEDHRVGLPYVNFQALKSLGVTINDGSFPDAYQSVIAGINANGGINGRKLVLHSVEMNPSVPAEATSSCTQLTEDDHVFVSISPVFPDLLPADPRHLGDRGIVAGTAAGQRARPTSRSSRPSANFDPIQLAAFKKAGDFKGKKVAIFYGADSDAPEVKVVQNDAQEAGVSRCADGRGQRAGDRRRGVRPGSPVHLPALPERGREPGDRCRRLGLDDVAPCAAGQPEHLQAHCTSPPASRRSSRTWSRPRVPTRT